MTAKPPARASKSGTDGAKAFDARLMGKLWKFVRPHRKLIALALALLGIMAALDVAVPYLMKVAIDSHIAVRETEGLLGIAVLSAILLLGSSVASAALAYVLALLGQRSMHELRCAVHSHVLTRSSSFFDRTPVGRLLIGITNDVENLNQIFIGGVVTLAADLVVLGLIISMMLYLSVELTVVTVLVVPLLIPLFAWSRRIMTIAFREIRVKVADLSTYVVERVSGVATIQIFCREVQAIRGYAEISAAYRKSSLASFLAGAVSPPATEAIAAVSGACVIWYAAGGIGETTVTVGLVVAFMGYANRFFGPVYILAQKYTMWQGAMAAAERIFALMDDGEPDAPARTAPIVVETSSGDGAGVAGEAIVPQALEFRDVHFGYRPTDPVLHGVTLGVPHGATVAVVGTTGSGKSTLVRLLARHYQPQSGEIRVQGRDIRDWPVHELRRHLTVISQDVFLFAGTVADNVRLGRPDADLRAVENALERVGGGRLLGRTGGVNAEVVERGANLSTGERQLVAFARALIRDPEVMILDEATAHVDPETEETIERALVTLSAGRTSLIIAHRLSTIRRADRIVVLGKGLVIEAGTRSELLAAGGVYAGMEDQLTSPRPPIAGSGS